jgi:hypothetical protein
MVPFVRGLDRSAVVLFVRCWPRNWRHSARLSLDLFQGTAPHLTQTVGLLGMVTNIERGGRCQKAEQNRVAAGRRYTLAGHFPNSKTERQHVSEAATEEMREVLCLESGVTVRGAVHGLNCRDASLLVRETPHAKELERMYRLGLQSGALQRRWISSGRHSSRPRVSETGLGDATTRKHASYSGMNCERSTTGMRQGTRRRISWPDGGSESGRAADWIGRGIQILVPGV